MSNVQNNSRALVPVNPENHASIPTQQPRKFYNPQVMVIFINTSNATVNVRWLFNDENYKDYGDIPPKRYVNNVTYYGHRWGFYDIKDGEIFTTNYNFYDDEEEMFYSPKLPNAYREGQESPKQYVFIHRPMQSLAYLALKVVATRPDFKELQLPTKIKEALMTYCDRKEEFLQQRKRDAPNRPHPNPEI